MKKFILLAAVFATFFSACKKDPYDDLGNKNQIPGKYENGFFIINEGWFGHGPGTLSFYDYTAKTLSDSIYQKENPGKMFSSSQVNLQWGKFYKGKFYLLVKAGDIIILDAKTMKESGRVSSKDWRDFLGIDDKNALVSTADGIYPLNLETLALGAKITGLSGEVLDMIATDKYIFISQDGTVSALNKGSYTLAKKFNNMDAGVVKTDDGNVWSAKGKSLYKIKSDLSTETIALGFSVRINTSFNLSQIIAGGNDIYLAASSGFTGPNNKVYKYVQGNTGSLTAPFIGTIPESKMVYNRGLGYDNVKKQLTVTTIDSNYGDGNTTYIFDATNGKQVIALDKKGYFYPSMPVYQK